MTHLIEPARNIGAFVIVLGILVFVHELGHYLAARWRGVYVEAFSIGFGPAIKSWTDRVGTVWKLSWLPLGGYVKMHGMERPQDVAPEIRASWKPGQTFHEKSVASRAIIVAAGPAANFLLTLVLFSGLFFVNGRPVLFPPNAPVFGEVAEQGAAARAGLQSRDRVTAIDAEPVEKFEDIRRIVEPIPGRLVQVHIVRDGVAMIVPVTIGSRDSPGKTSGVLGVGNNAIDHYESLGPIDAISAGTKQTWDVAVATLQGVGQMLNGSRTTEELSGPLGIAQLSGRVSHMGLAIMVSFIAVLSVNLGLVNLFPIPVLDGGHLVFYAIEAIRGRPLPPRMQEYGFRAGFALLAGLFVFATWNDLSHMGLFRWVTGLWG